jgi:hypothetical protein
MNAVRLVDTDGTDDGGTGGETAEYFLGLFTALSHAAGVQVPASLLEACADAVDEYVEGMAEFIDDEDAYRRRWLRDLPVKRRPRLILIGGGKPE